VTFRLAIRDGFSAAHRIRGSGGRCEDPHGHNFQVELAVVGDELDPVTGMLLDFTVLKRVLSGILSDLDHRDLNEHPDLSGMSPSSEVLARYVLKRAREAIDSPGVLVESVTVWESERASATCRPVAWPGGEGSR